MKGWRATHPVRRAAFHTVGSWNPIAGSPVAALETDAALGAFGPSLMPRTSLHQGIAAGLAVLAGRSVGTVAELATSALAGSPALKPRLVAAAAVAGASAGVAHLPAYDGESLALSAVRSGGSLMAVGALNGLVYDLAMAGRDRVPGPAAPRIALTSLAGAGAVLLVARRRLRAPGGGGAVDGR